jgi:HTH-type transcriptional regulator/antitoxin HigA
MLRCIIYNLPYIDCKLTVEHIQKLAEYFKVSPAVFFPAKSSNDFLEVA